MPSPADRDRADAASWHSVAAIMTRPGRWQQRADRTLRRAARAADDAQDRSFCGIAGDLGAGLGRFGSTLYELAKLAPEEGDNDCNRRQRGGDRVDPFGQGGKKWLLPRVEHAVQDKRLQLAECRKDHDQCYRADCGRRPARDLVSVLKPL